MVFSFQESIQALPFYWVKRKDNNIYISKNRFIAFVAAKLSHP
jgi:hypothetical protein